VISDEAVELLFALDGQAQLAAALAEDRDVLGQGENEIGQISALVVPVVEDRDPVDDEGARVVDAHGLERPAELVDERGRLDLVTCPLLHEVGPPESLQLLPGARRALDDVAGEVQVDPGDEAHHRPW
jgi:hypothetical protein